MSEWLVNADADRIQDHIFATQQLRLIRGASMLQRDLNRHLLPQEARLLGGNVITSCGGTVLARFQSELSAGRFIDRAGNIFVGSTGSATITCVSVPYPEGAFEHALEASKQLLQRTKNGRAEPVFQGSRPFWAICSACGLYPAKSATNEGELLCRTCEICSDRGQRQEDGVVLLAPDFEWIGKQSSPENYVALLYLDLDRMGKWLPGAAGNSESRYAKLSESIENTVDKAIRNACGRLQPAQEDGKLYSIHEILFIGGDDAALVVPADRAFEVLEAFREGLKGFRSQYREVFPQKPPPPSFSAGMVVAHSHFPIGDSMRIARDLVRSAKKIGQIDSIDYEILSESMTDRVLNTRKKVAELGDARWRTQKPYSIDELLTLRSGIASLKTHAPASKIKSLYPISYRGPIQAEMDYLSLLMRLDEKSKSEVRKLVGLSLWKTAPDGRVRTGAADLAELWDFVPADAGS
jgi:hypothetical protein